MIDRLHHAARMQIRIVQQLERIQHGSARDARSRDDFRYLLLGALRGPVRNRGVDSCLVLGAGGPVGHARIGQQVLATDRTHQTAPMVLVAPRAENVAPIIQPTRRTFVETAWRRADDAIATARYQILASGLPTHWR